MSGRGERAQPRPSDQRIPAQLHTPGITRCCLHAHALVPVTDGLQVLFAISVALPQIHRKRPKLPQNPQLSSTQLTGGHGSSMLEPWEVLALTQNALGLVLVHSIPSPPRRPRKPAIFPKRGGDSAAIKDMQRPQKGDLTKKSQMRLSPSQNLCPVMWYLQYPSRYLIASNGSQLCNGNGHRAQIMPDPSSFDREVAGASRGTCVPRSVFRGNPGLRWTMMEWHLYAVTDSPTVKVWPTCPSLLLANC